MFMPNIFMIIIKILILLTVLMITIMVYTFWERRFIGLVQDRYGPNRVGFCGIMQPIADTIKLLVKSMIIPTRANKFLFIFFSKIRLKKAFHPRSTQLLL